jgi:predicted transcriptional regulator
VRRFGELERAIMDALWQADRPLLVREVVMALAVDHRPALAYNTVQTVADRLTRKGFLERIKDGKAFRYQTRHSREDHVVAVMLEAMTQAPDRAPILARFAEAVPPGDAQQLLQALAQRVTHPPMPT